jgi:hypothetical protein
VDKHINETTMNDYKNYIDENRGYWHRTQSRMISYWNEYYRHPNCKKLKDYIGKQIVDRIEIASTQ